MKSIFFSFVAIFVAVSSAQAAGRERKLYVGSDSTEALLAFNAAVELASATQPTLAQAEAQVHKQVTHLFGPMSKSFAVAVPRRNHQISNLKIAPKGRGLWTIAYTYQGTIVLQNGPNDTYEVTLPVNPDTIYRPECTDAHYQIPQYFWYFWDPKMPGCRLQANVDYIVIKGSIRRLGNTPQTFPEYERLADANGVVMISLLMGMDNSGLEGNPNISRDINAANYRSLKKGLVSSGYQSREWSASEIQRIVQAPRFKMPFVEEFTKVIDSRGRRLTLTVRLFFGATAITEESTAFHWFLKDAMENSSVMIYAGHSGLGEYLDLPVIEKRQGFQIRPNPNRYQIYYFNSCSSYPYYNTQYFGRKSSPLDAKGTKNLDILTNGLSTYFSVLPNTIFALISSIDAAGSGRARISYQQMTRQIDSGNLFGVNGDEDNPIR